MTNKSINCFQRDEQLLDLYNKTLNFMIHARVPNPHTAALTWCLENGHPRYHMSFERAYKVMKSLILHNRHVVQRKISQDLWNEVATKVKQLMDARKGISIAKALEFVLLNGEASRFYLTFNQADRNIRACKRRRAQRRLQSIRINH